MSPLLRFNGGLMVTVLLLALSLGQVYRWYGKADAPVIDAEFVLQAVEQLQSSSQPLECRISAQNDCSDALFVEYPAGYWGGYIGNDNQEGADQNSVSTNSIGNFSVEVFAMHDSQQRLMLCRSAYGGKILCINKLQPPDRFGQGLDLAYVFYLLLFLLIFLLSRNLFRDIEILRRSAISEIKFGKFPAFSLSPKSYLAPLAQSLRNMTANIEQLNQFQAEVAETVCHDIKTPLARIKFLSHLMTADNIVTTREQLNSNISDIEDNIYDYLSLAENEYCEVGNEKCTLELGQFIRDQIALVPSDNDIAIRLDISEVIEFSCYRNLMKRLVNNLLANALRYAASTVHINCYRHDKGVSIEIEDDGPGWGAEEIQAQLVLEHHKLGLSIVRRVVAKHQGQMYLGPSALGGAKVTVCLPGNV